MRQVLEVKDLCTSFFTRKGVVRAVDKVSFSIEKGQILGIVGESGAGKSITGFSIIRLIDPPGKIESGSIRIDGRNILALPREQVRMLRGKTAGMIFQDPQTSLNPVLTVRRQLFETLACHHPEISKEELRHRSIEKLKAVGLPGPEQRLNAYPHELSGGMKQRIVIAMALLNDPRLLIADEPTTALDVTIQAQILMLMKRLCANHGSALVLITHDIGVVSQLCDHVAVMYAGRIVEYGTKQAVLFDPMHPYTKGLIRCLPTLNHEQGRLVQIDGVMPSLLSLPEGCHFRPRCPDARTDCMTYPEERKVNERRVSCHRIF